MTLFSVGVQDAQLAKARLERDSRRRQKEQMTDETDKLVSHVELLKRSVSPLFPQTTPCVENPCTY